MNTQEVSITKHTPGPWSVGHVTVNTRERKWKDIFVPGGHIARCYLDTAVGSQQAANIKLIAAAPELLAALREIIEQARYQGFGDPVSRMSYAEHVARDAIAKAEWK